MTEFTVKDREKLNSILDGQAVILSRLARVENQTSDISDLGEVLLEMASKVETLSVSNGIPETPPTTTISVQGSENGNDTSDDSSDNGASKTMSTGEAAKLLFTSEATVRNVIKEGYIPAEVKPAESNGRGTSYYRPYRSSVMVLRAKMIDMFAQAGYSSPKKHTGWVAQILRGKTPKGWRS